MSSSCRSLEAERGGVVGEVVHLDPGSEPSHELERANSCLRQGREADSFKHRLMHHGGSVGRAKGSIHLYQILCCTVTQQ